MFGLEMLDVMIGLVTVYLVFGLACTSVVEAVAALLSLRSTFLETAMNEFLAGDISEKKAFAAAFFEHPLIQSLSRDKRNGERDLPSYIPPEIVGRVVEALLVTDDETLSLPDAVNALPGKSQEGEKNRIKGLLHTLVVQADGDAAAFRKAVETHFNAVMGRTSGWFKRRQQTISIAVSAVLVIFANVDSVSLVASLSSNPEVRSAMVKNAGELLEKRKAETEKLNKDKTTSPKSLTEAETKYEAAQAAYDTATHFSESAGLSLGWRGWWTAKKTFSDFVTKFAGLTVSIFAISLGAPFWFDILQRFMQVRTTGPRNETERKKRELPKDLNKK